MICKSQTRATAALLRNLPASDLAARGSSRRRCVPFRRLARGCGAVLVAGAAARAARRIRLAVPRDVGVCGSPLLLAEPDGAGLGARDRGLRGAPPVLDRRVGAVRRTERARGPGPVRAGVDGAPRLRARTRRPADRRRPDLRLRRRRRRRGVARALRSRRGRRSAAGRAERERAALGEPALRLAGAPRDGLPLVDRALPAGRSSSSTSRESTTSAASSRTGRSRRSTRPRETASGGAGRATSSSTQSSTRSATCR